MNKLNVLVVPSPAASHQLVIQAERAHNTYLERLSATLKEYTALVNSAATGNFTHTKQMWQDMGEKFVSDIIDASGWLLPDQFEFCKARANDCFFRAGTALWKHPGLSR